MKDGYICTYTSIYKSFSKIYSLNHHLENHLSKNYFLYLDEKLCICGPTVHLTFFFTNAKHFLDLTSSVVIAGTVGSQSQMRAYEFMIS